MADLSTQPDIQMFGKTLKSLRERAGMSQKALADASGVTVKQISKLENGRAEPKYLTLIAFADAMRVSMNDFRTPQGWRWTHDTETEDGSDGGPG